MSISLMKILSAEFVKSCNSLSGCPSERLPEMAFVGRSNVGKSSLLNALLHRKGLSKVSRDPGKTRLINFFKVNERFYFVDLPGYGFARVPKEVTAGWRALLEGYLTQRSQLKGLILLIDSRIGATPMDCVMKEWLEARSIPPVLVATKIDKIPRSKHRSSIQEIERALSVSVNHKIFPISSRTGEGLPALWLEIRQLLMLS
jgi:GTP-binding protein